MPQESTRILVFDTTLRDGEQAPGFSMDVKAKLTMARALMRWGWTSWRRGSDRLARRLRSHQTDRARGAPADHRRARRCRDIDIDEAARAPSRRRKRIHTFLATSDLHLERKLRITREACLEQIVNGVSRARNYCDDVEFPRRTPPAIVISSPCRRGARSTPARRRSTCRIRSATARPTMREFFEGICERVPNADRAVFSTHRHDDLGLAVANSIAAISGRRPAD
jgi:2-isopropylmalate synthase